MQKKLDFRDREVEEPEEECSTCANEGRKSVMILGGIMGLGWIVIEIMILIVKSIINQF